MNDPRDDQVGARQRDLERLFELAEPHMTGTKVPDDLLSRMSEDDRTEAVAILELLNLGDDPEEVRERQKILLGLAFVEAHLREVLDKGQPRFRKGKVLRDPHTGEVLRNRNIDRSAQATLRKLERLRSQITGLPLSGGDQG